MENVGPHRLLLSNNTNESISKWTQKVVYFEKKIVKSELSFSQTTLTKSLA
jgi:hypothetical protein